MLTQDIKITLKIVCSFTNYFFDVYVVNTCSSKVLMKYIPVVSIEHLLQISQSSSEQLHFIWHSVPQMDKDILGNRFLLGTYPYMQNKISNIDWNI